MTGAPIKIAPASRRRLRLMVCLALACVGQSVSGAMAQGVDPGQLRPGSGVTQMQSDDGRWQATYGGGSSGLLPDRVSSMVVGASDGLSDRQPEKPLLVGKPWDNLAAWSAQPFDTGSGRSSPGGSSPGPGGQNSSFASVTYTGLDRFQPFASVVTVVSTRGGWSGGSRFAGLNSGPSEAETGASDTALTLASRVGINFPVSNDFLASLFVQYASGYASHANSGGNMASGGVRMQDAGLGDAVLVGASLRRQFGRLSLDASSSISFDAPTTGEGSALNPATGRYLLSAALGYGWSERWSSSAAVSFSYMGRNGPSAAAASGGGPPTPLVAASSDPALLKWTAGVRTQVALMSDVSLVMSAERVWVSGGENLDLSAQPSGGARSDISGWLLSFGGRIRF